MHHPLDIPNLVILDSETTGLDHHAEIIELSVIDRDGQPLIDTLIKPVGHISDESSAIHGITNADVQDAPTWAEIYPQLVGLCLSHTLGIYNASFDIRMIQQTCAAHQLAFQPIQDSVCLMHWYAKHWGEKNSHGDYKWQRLTNAASQQGIDISDLTAHRALSDCEITRRLLFKTK